MPGFMVHNDDASYDIQIRVRYPEQGTPTSEQLCTALTNSYAEAFAEITKRLGEPE